MPVLPSLRRLCLVFLLAVFSGPAVLAAEGSAGIRSLLESSRFGPLGEPLLRFYAASGYAPVWSKEGRATPQAGQILALLQQAGRHGLDPDDYVPAASGGESEADLAISAALFRFLSEVHGGRVNPRLLGFELDLTPARLDLPSLVREALANNTVPTLADRVAPRFGAYERLGKALAIWRERARHPFVSLPEVRKLEPGRDYGALAALAGRLVEEGDLSPSVTVPARYEGVLVEAMKRFQARHGLVADGVIGKSSFEQLNASPRSRVRQIELAMERLRWIRPVESPSRKLIVVNVPEFRLRAFGMVGERMEPRLSMEVIVGKAVNTHTPIFDEDMRSIEFKPYWNVPPSIARGELLPKLRRNPGYLAKENMEFVPTGGGAPITAVTPETLSGVSRGALRIRQRPGGNNALGDIKFVLPNNMNIYLHHTSAPGLFSRSRRDFSHGCIRVEDPVALAKFVLEDQPAWGEERIRAAMDAEQPSTVHLLHPVPVVIFYVTAVVQGDGGVLFLPDLYGLDRRLDEALKAHSATLRGS